MRKHPRRARVDPTDPAAWATSDRDGMVGNLRNMKFQHDWRGPRIINTKILVHEDELDIPQRQLGSPALLGPDPVPVSNARPEQYNIDEYPVSTRYTLDGRVRVVVSTSTYPVDLIVTLPFAVITDSNRA